MTRHALILAAGKGSRFGYPKSWISFHGVPLVQAHINAIKDQMPVRVVVSSLVDTTSLYDCTIIHNPHGESMMSSIQEGITGLPHTDRILIVPVDTVPIETKELFLLTSSSPPAVLSHHNQPGHPIWITVDSIH